MVTNLKLCILIEANRGGSVRFYYINPQHLQTEIQVSQPLTSGEQILESTINLPPGLGGSSTGDRIGYTLLTTTPGPPYDPATPARPEPSMLSSRRFPAAPIPGGRLPPERA